MRPRTHSLPPHTVNRFAIFVAALALCAPPCPSQSPPAGADDSHGMVMTSAGLIAVDTPPGWEQTTGPGLAAFMPQNLSTRDPDTLLILTSSPIEAGSAQQVLDAFIASDVAAFRHRFPGAVVHPETPIALPHYSGSAPVYSFQSGDPAHNPFEQVAYIADYRRIWLLTLSARNKSDLEHALPAFHAVVASYRGSIQYDNTK